MKTKPKILKYDKASRFLLIACLFHGSRSTSLRFYLSVVVHSSCRAKYSGGTHAEWVLFLLKHPDGWRVGCLLNMMTVQWRNGRMAQGGTSLDGHLQDSGKSVLYWSECAMMNYVLFWLVINLVLYVKVKLVFNQKVKPILFDLLFFNLSVGTFLIVSTSWLWVILLFLLGLTYYLVYKYSRKNPPL